MDNIEKLQEITGLSRSDMEKCMEKVKENRAKRDSCKRHEFVAGVPRFGKYTCKNCGCVEDSSFVVGYEQGLKHGGDGNV